MGERGRGKPGALPSVPSEQGGSNHPRWEAPRVLFHNGTWGGFKDALAYIERAEKRKVGGPISDSRVMALLVNHLHDPHLLQSVDGRFVLMGATKTNLFGDWREWQGMRCSNLGFLYELERGARPQRKSANDQLALWAAVAIGAYAVIVMHNHPSGEALPSEVDRRITQRLAEAGRIIQISLTDHLIVGTNSCFSFREAGLV